MKVVMIDYGAGNISSVQNAFHNLSIDVRLSSDAQEIKSADKVILPGVGHAAHAMASLQKSGLVEVIKELEQPLLGICLGMQMLCERSEEEDTQTLGLVPETVKRFVKPNKIPHMGWNQVLFEPDSIFSPLSGEYFYFVHSYYVPDQSFTLGHCDYYGKFSAVVKKDNFYGCQFHPEKSAEAGLKFLHLFVNQTP